MQSITQTELGARLRAARLRADLTQEKLAERLGVTAQTISKWENSLSCPDILLLPELTATLGITLDELLACGAETQLQRIDHMLEYRTPLTDEDFAYAERVLEPNCQPGAPAALRGESLTLRARLYLQRAEDCKARAVAAAQLALAVEPEKRANHSILNMAWDGHVWDWCCNLHTEYIDYYKRFVAEHSGYRPAYLWLAENLIADGRLAEADEAVETMRKAGDGCQYWFFKGMIAERGGDRAAADALWQQMVELYPDDWLAWSYRGDGYAQRGDFASALGNYRRADELEPTPHPSDDLYSIALCCELLGDPEGAVAAGETALARLREEEGLTEGHMVEMFQKDIARYRRKMAVQKESDVGEA